VHKKEYGVNSEDSPVALVTLRVTGYSESERTLENKLALDKKIDDQTNSVKSERDVYFDGKKNSIEIHDIRLIKTNQKIKGPAIIEHPNSEIVVPPRSTATVDSYGFIHIDLAKKVTVSEMEVMS